jgi:tRNA-2-methylthio-N6-dimethylallyladenosine synthase
MPSVFFQTFGCQMNISDSDELHGMLSQRGFVTAQNPESADLIIVNTCSVREHAEKRAMARIFEFTRKKKRGASVWVTGCMAQRLGDKLKESIPGISLVIGARKIDQLDEILDKSLGVFPPAEVNNSLEENSTGDFVSVMRGCNNFCAYCIVPYVRGPEKSIPDFEILETVEKKVAEGKKEITLLGQNVNSYDYNGTGFSELLERVASVNGLRRVRFTTSHPKDLSDKLIKVIAENKNVCKHIHLPVQSGSDRILTLMNRRYNSSYYFSVIDRIKQALPDADITTDLLVGFPSETEDDFLRTMELVEKVRFTTAFMFAYSVREGTEAAGMQDSVCKEEKLDRLNRIIALQTKITKEIYDFSVGKELEVLVNGRLEKRERAWIAQDNGCKRALLSCDGLQAGMILNVKAIRSTGMTLVCERI